MPNVHPSTEIDNHFVKPADLCMLPANEVNLIRSSFYG